MSEPVFHLFPPFKHDLARMTAGDCKIVPSRCMFCNPGWAYGKAQDASTSVSVNFTYSLNEFDPNGTPISTPRQATIGPNEYNTNSNYLYLEDYQLSSAKAKAAYSFICAPTIIGEIVTSADHEAIECAPDGTWATGPDETNDVSNEDTFYIPAVSDISFAGSDEHNGYHYYEMVCMVTSEDGMYFYAINSAIAAPIVDNHTPGQYLSSPVISNDSIDASYALTPMFLNPVKCTNESWIRINSEMTFGNLVIFYDVYEGDTLVVKDMPMGVVECDGGNIFRKESTLYGGGTTWSMRIGLRIADVDNRDIRVDVQGADGDTYTTLTKVLSGFGECISKMNDITASHMHQLNDIKSYLSEMKNNRTTNVPSIKTVGQDKYWEVNGKIISKMPNAKDMAGEVLDVIKDKVVTHNGIEGAITIE